VAGQHPGTLGDLSTYHVRVDVDERDIGRVRNGTPARAFPRGETGHEMALRLVRVEPYVVWQRVSFRGACSGDGAGGLRLPDASHRRRDQKLATFGLRMTRILHAWLILHPSSFIIHHSSFILVPSSLFDHAFGIESEGNSAGAACPLPVGRQRSAV